MQLLLRMFVLFTLVLVTIASESDVKRNTEDNSDLDPIQDTEQNLPEKDHSKRTFGSTAHDTYGLAKHVKIKGGQKVVLGYTPVDLKYVPVIKPWRNGWRFKERPVSQPRPFWRHPMRPKPDSNGWKPLLHVPPPQPSHDWNKPSVTVLQPMQPSAPDHSHNDEQHNQPHNHHHHSYDNHHHVHHDVHHDIVHDHHPLVVPTVAVPVPTVPVQVHAHDLPLPHQHHHGHFDFMHSHPQVVYYNPLTQIARPELPVLPLGASFPIPVGSIAPLAVGSVVPVPPPAPVPLHTDYYHPHYKFVPSVEPVQPHLDVVHEVPAPHFHPTQVVPVPATHLSPIPAAVAAPNYYATNVHDHIYDHHVHKHIPQVHEYPMEAPDIPVAPLGPQPLAHAAHSVEYHGHASHLIPTPYQIPHHAHYAHQYVPENFNPHILPGSTGALSSGFLNPGYTDLQIPEHLPEHPTYTNQARITAPTEATYYREHVGLLPEGIVEPPLALEPPIDK